MAEEGKRKRREGQREMVRECDDEKRIGNGARYRRKDEQCIRG